VAKGWLPACSIERVRARAPFVDLNCAAMPEHLVESELFGYERGAFTDARRAKPGLFQTAHRGVIFLDEIGELREPTQAKLLKVLEEGVVRRLGATETEPADVWVISATNADLEAAVRQRAFREDLYHRLAVLTLRLLPLRERGRDVILLARRFLDQACTEYGLSPKRLSPDAEERILRHPWPGNVRALDNVMECGALLAEGDNVTASMLELRGAPEMASVGQPAPIPTAASLEDAMRDHLLTGLEQTRRNISRTAVLLDISRNTVRARIDRFG
jgi:two-component system, NtrC family, response regulator AtoC